MTFTSHHRSARARGALAGSVAALTVLASAGTALAAGSVPADDLGHSGRDAYQRLTSERVSADLVRVDLLAINDFHGALEPVDPKLSSSGRINNTPAGGAAFLARHLDRLRDRAEQNEAATITVAAGDLIGASPLLSAAFHDEPTIKAMNRIGLQVASVGNHEFDEGYRELLRMQRGGCLDDGDGRNNQDSCPGGTGFRGAEFQYLGANVRWAEQQGHRRPTVFPATKVIKVQGIKVGFIGMTLQDTPSIVTQSGVAGLKFTDEVRTANRIVPVLKERGVEAIVVLLHQGVVPTDSASYDACTGITGPALEIGKNLHSEIDAVITGHTHQPYNCVIHGPDGRRRLMTSAASFGRLITDVHLLLNPRTGDVARRAAYAQNKIVTNNLDGLDSDTAPDANTRPVRALVSLIEKFKELVEPIANQVVGHIAPEGETNSLTKSADDSGESPLGNLIADAQKNDPSVVPPSGKKPVIAFMNPGGIRADLVENTNGDVTYEAAFTVQPFNNFDVSMDLTGQQILDLLDQQWAGGNAAPNNKILQVSGIEYTWDESAEPGDKVVDGSVVVDHDGDPSTIKVPLVPADSYRVVANSFLSDGGDNFSVFTGGQDKYVGGLDIDALTRYLEANDPYTPVPTDRIDVRD